MRRGQPIVGTQHGFGAEVETQPRQPGRCQQSGIDSIVLKELGQPSADITPDRNHRDIRPHRFHQRRPSSAAGGHHRTLRQVFQHQARTKARALLAPRHPVRHGILLSSDPNPVPIQQNLTDIGTRTHRSQCESIRQFRGQILEAVDGQIGTAFQEGHLQLLGEQSLGQGLRSRRRRGLERITRGSDHFQFEAFTRKGRLKVGLNLTGLGQCQGAAPGGDEDGSIQGHGNQAAGERRAKDPKRRATSNSAAASRIMISHRATSSRRWRVAVSATD